MSAPSKDSLEAILKRILHKLCSRCEEITICQPRSAQYLFDSYNKALREIIPFRITAGTELYDVSLHEYHVSLVMSEEDTVGKSITNWKIKHEEEDYLTCIECVAHVSPGVLVSLSVMYYNGAYTAMLEHTEFTPHTAVFITTCAEFNIKVVP